MERNQSHWIKSRKSRVIKVSHREFSTGVINAQNANSSSHLLLPPKLYLLKGREQTARRNNNGYSEYAHNIT